MMSINVDIPPVDDEQHALVLLRHHLEMAAAYFEAAPDPLPSDFMQDHHSRNAVGAWLHEQELAYSDREGE